MLNLVTFVFRTLTSRKPCEVYNVTGCDSISVLYATLVPYLRPYPMAYSDEIQHGITCGGGTFTGQPTELYVKNRIQ